MQIQPMNIQTEGLEAQVRRLAYRRRRDGMEVKKERKVNLHTPASPVPLLFRRKRAYAK